MKRLLYLVVVAFTCQLSAQSFTVRNANDDYFVATNYNSEISKNNLSEFIRDQNGIYWFQYNNEILSFDGVNWKSHQLKSLNGHSTPFLLNDIETTDDGNIWLATENGFYVFDRLSDCFISIKEKFPDFKNLPATANACFKGPFNTLIFLSFSLEGFYVLDLKSKEAIRVVVDSIHKTRISIHGQQITADRAGNIWGSTIDNKGVWQYNLVTKRLLCSWKGELTWFAHKRFKSFANYTYSEQEKALWIVHVSGRYLEKMDLTTGQSIFYSFYDDLKVRSDTNINNRRTLFMVRIDRDNNSWLNVGEGKYMVKLNKDISQMEYLTNDKDIFPIGDMEKFRTETGIRDDRNNILLWVFGTEKFSIIRKRGEVARHTYFDTLSSTGVKPQDFLNTDNSDGTRQKIFFEKGRSGHYFLLQQSENRPKVICFDKDFRIIKTLLNDQWKQYPAYFRREFEDDTFYIAILRPDIEPLNFRNIVLKDFRVDLNTFSIEETKLDFKQRVWRYGSADKYNVYWLLSNGSLYSYDPAKDILDSIFISKPDAKKGNVVNLVKGFGYPTSLHKNSSTFWISFYPVRELYKINLVTRKIDKIFKPCMNQRECNIPGVIYNMYTFDSSHIYFKSTFHGMLLNTETDSVLDLSGFVQKKVPAEGPVGVNLFKEWACVVFPSHIYLMNRITGLKRELLIDDDFKWKITPFLSRPLINDNGELVLMSLANKGFIAFNVDSPIQRTKPGAVSYSFIKVDNRNLLLDSLMKSRGLILKYNSYNNIQIAFSDHSVFDPEKTSYEYALYKGNDTSWTKINGKPELIFSDLSPGQYQLLLRAANVYGDYSEKSNAFNIIILPRWWQTWWFRSLVLLSTAVFFYSLYWYRLQQLKKLQAIRNNIASDLHDDIGSTLNSISIYSEVAKQQAGKEIPALEMIGQNSRKIIESMSDIVWTINPDNDSFEKIITRMRSFAHQLLKAKKVEYTFEVDEEVNSITLPMQVRKNFYLVFKEAVTNLVKYSGASRVAISLKEENKTIFLKIRDNGIGIPINPETQGNGLINMKRRAEEIRANLNIISSTGDGTGIELTLRT